MFWNKNRSSVNERLLELAQQLKQVNDNRTLPQGERVQHILQIAEQISVILEREAKGTNQ